MKTRYVIEKSSLFPFGKVKKEWFTGEAWSEFPTDAQWFSSRRLAEKKCAEIGGAESHTVIEFEAWD